MPGCVLRVSGLDFDVGHFWAASPWQEYTGGVFHRGTPSGHPTKRVHEKSGFWFGISDCDEDQLEQQIQDSIEFLTEDRDELERLAAFPGVDEMYLSIGLIWWADTICQTHSLPPKLMRLAGELGVEISLSIYGVDQDRPSDQ